jgi:hypothetical protein
MDIGAPLHREDNAEDVLLSTAEIVAKVLCKFGTLCNRQRSMTYQVSGPYSYTIEQVTPFAISNHSPKACTSITLPNEIVVTHANLNSALHGAQK